MKLVVEGRTDGPTDMRAYRAANAAKKVFPTKVNVVVRNMVKGWGTVFRGRRGL